MDIDPCFLKIAAHRPFIVARSESAARSAPGREDQAMMSHAGGLIVVLSMLVRQISDLFVLIKALLSYEL